MTISARTSKNDFLTDISRGKFGDFSAFNLAGYNPSLPNGTEEDLWSEGGSLVYLSSEETMSYVSNNAADTSPLALLVGGVNDAGDRVFDFVLLNGVTPVIGTTPFAVVDFMFLTGTGVTNAGAITATATTAGTVQCGIIPGRGISQNGFIRIPSGKAALIKQIELNAAKLSGGGAPLVEFKLYIRSAPTTPWIVILDRRVDTGVDNDIIIPFPISGTITAGADLRLSATSSAANTEAQMRIQGVQYDV